MAKQSLPLRPRNISKKTSKRTRVSFYVSTMPRESGARSDGIMSIRKYGQLHELEYQFHNQTTFLDTARRHERLRESILVLRSSKAGIKKKKVLFCVRETGNLLVFVWSEFHGRARTPSVGASTVERV